MEKANLFEVATRKKMRFPYNGMISVEELWDLKPEKLDVVYKALSAEVKHESEDSLMKKATEADDELTAKLEIVKYIFNVKTNEIKERLAEKETNEQIQKLMSIKAAKQETALNEKSVEELEAMIEELKKKK